MHVELKKIIDSSTLSFFAYKSGLEKIEKFFSSTLDDARSDWLYRAVGYLSEETWGIFCEAAPSRFDRMPTGKQILDILAPKIREGKERRMGLIIQWHKDKGQANCQCQFTGIISRFDELNRSYVFRCPDCSFHAYRGLCDDVATYNPQTMGHLTARKLDAKDKMWKDIYRYGGKYEGLRRAIRVGPEVVWQEIFEKGLVQ